MNNEALAEFREQLHAAVAAGEITAEEAEKRERVHLANSEEKSHLGSHFQSDASRRGKTLVIAESEDPYEIANNRAMGRRASKISDMVTDALVDRVQDASGPSVMRVTFKEFEAMIKDPEFQTFAKYGPNLIFYTLPNGQPDMEKPRPKPVRPLLANEVGTWRDKIVCLRDAGPDDVGEGKYHTPGVQLERTEPASAILGADGKPLA
jgi:hypothetical protein